MLKMLIINILKSFGLHISRIEQDAAEKAKKTVKRDMYGKLVSHNDEVDIFKYSGSSGSLSEQFREKLSSGIYKIYPNSCPVCEGDSFTNVANSHEGFKWGVCNSCGLLQMHARLRNEDLKLFYESGEYQAMCMGSLDDKTHFMLEHKVMSLYFLDIIEKLGLEQNGLSVMEIGCGSGGILYALKENGAIVKGYDLDQHRVEYGRQFLPEIETADAMNNSLEWSEKLDLLILSNMLEHLSDPQEFMRTIHSRIGDRRTRILIDIPNLEGSYAYSPGSFLDFLQISHIWYFSPITIERLLNQAGFRIEFVFNRGAAFTVVCEKADEAIVNTNNAYWNSISSINYANFANDPDNIGRLAKEAMREILNSSERV